MMNKNDAYTTISRRSFIIGGIKVLSFGALITRLGYLQLHRFNDYKLLSDKNRIRVLPVIPARGEILDAIGRNIVHNKYIYKLVMDKEYRSSLNEVYEKISKILYIKSFKRPDISCKTNQFVLVEDLTWSEIAKLSIFISNMPGVSIERYTDRECVNEEAFCHVVGYTADDPYENILGYKAGVIGIEKEKNDILRGELGEKSVEVNVIGKMVRDLDSSPPTSGKNVELSINLDVQEFVYSLFQEYHAGACVVMDIFTGEIVAMVSYPGYGFKNFSTQTWESLKNDPLKPLTNRVIYGAYPPGSVFKLVTAIALLESGKVHDVGNVNCSQVYRLGNHDFHCWRKGGHGSVDLRRAIAESCDIFFYSASRIAGIQKISEYAKILGFGERTGIELSGEHRGLIPDPEWKRSVYKEPWYPYETILSAIGQGSVLTTQLQLVRAVSIIANGGFKIQPTLIKRNELELLERVEISESTLSFVSECMSDVCNKPNGTAYWSLLRNNIKGVLAGKTGTSQVVRITKEERESGTYKDFNSKPWEQRDHALFVGFAPVASPKYAVSVILEHEISGAKFAAPFAAKVLKYVSGC